MAIKLLRATTQGQGQRASDYTWTTEGELVYFSLPCGGRHKPDAGCSCQRAMLGLDSKRSTTTAVVAEADITREEFIDAVCDHLRRAGFTVVDSDPGVREEVADNVDHLLAVVARLEVGAVIEFRGRLQARQIAAAEPAAVAGGEPG